MKFMAGALWTLLFEAVIFIGVKTDWHASVSPLIGFPWSVGFLSMVAAILGLTIYGIFYEERG